MRILLFGHSEDCQTVRARITDEELTVISVVTEENNVMEEVDRSTPDILLACDTAQVTLRTCQQIYILRPRCTPVVMGDKNDSYLMAELMSLGIHYVIPKNADSLGLSYELKGIYSNESKRLLAMDNTNSASCKSKVLAVLGAKDGIGKTTFAVSLAVELSQRGNKVVVLDYDMQFGDVSSYFGMNPKESIIELLEEEGNPHIDTIRQYMSMHRTGVSFLPSPLNPENHNAVSLDQADRIISILRMYYDFVVIDTPAGLNDVSMMCMDTATQVFLITTPDIPMVRNTKKVLGILQMISDLEKIRLILNREKKNKVSKDAVEKTLGTALWKSLPEDEKSVCQAADQGNPLVREKRGCRLSKMIRQIAAEIDVAEEKKPKRLLKKGDSSK